MLYSTSIKIDKVEFKLSGTTEDGIKFTFDSESNTFAIALNDSERFLKETLESSVKSLSKDIQRDLMELANQRAYSVNYKVHP